MDRIRKAKPEAVINRVKMWRPREAGGDWVVTLHISAESKFHVCMGRGQTYQEALDAAVQRFMERVGLVDEQPEAPGK